MMQLTAVKSLLIFINIIKESFWQTGFTPSRALPEEQQYQGALWDSCRVCLKAAPRQLTLWRSLWDAVGEIKPIA